MKIELIPKNKHQTEGVNTTGVDNVKHRAMRYFGIKVELYKSKWAKRQERRLDFSAAKQLGFSDCHSSERKTATTSSTGTTNNWLSCSNSTGMASLG